MTTSMLMFINTTWTGQAMVSTVAFYAIAFGGTGQLLAGLLDVSDPLACLMQCSTGGRLSVVPVPACSIFSVYVHAAGCACPGVHAALTAPCSKM